MDSAALKCLLLMFCLMSTAMAARKRKQPGSKHYLKLEMLKDCPGTNYGSKVIEMKKNFSTIGIDGSFIVTQEKLPAKLSASFAVKKCKTLEDTDCEHYMSGVVDYCKVLVDKGQFYSSGFEAVHPRMKCPIKKGVYQIRNATLDNEAMNNLIKFIPPEYWEYHWVIKFHVFPTGRPNQIISCSLAAFVHAFYKS